MITTYINKCNHVVIEKDLQYKTIRVIVKQKDMARAIDELRLKNEVDENIALYTGWTWHY
jgi:hypothetical protein